MSNMPVSVPHAKVVTTTTPQAVDPAPDPLWFCTDGALARSEEIVERCPRG